MQRFLGERLFAIVFVTLVGPGLACAEMGVVESLYSSTVTTAHYARIESFRSQASTGFPEGLLSPSQIQHFLEELEIQLDYVSFRPEAIPLSFSSSKEAVGALKKYPYSGVPSQSLLLSLAALCDYIAESGDHDLGKRMSRLGTRWAKHAIIVTFLNENWALRGLDEDIKRKIIKDKGATSKAVGVAAIKDSFKRAGREAPSPAEVEYLWKHLESGHLDISELDTVVGSLPSDKGKKKSP
ncbi:MAG: hypothetical protein WC943_00455 [Elusimicrobiota bacterium]|jgi:hypothetical protein